MWQSHQHTLCRSYTVGCNALVAESRDTARSVTELMGFGVTAGGGGQAGSSVKAADKPEGRAVQEGAAAV